MIQQTACTMISKSLVHAFCLLALLGGRAPCGRAPASVGHAAADQAAATPHYIGSVVCKSCHSEIYARWKETPMANVVRDPRENPGVILPDLSKPDPLVQFNKDQIALVYGSVWKQRYFTKIGDDYSYSRRNGMSPTASGAATSWRTERTGGRRSTRLTT